MSSRWRKKLQARTFQGYLHSINVFLNFYRDFISPGEMEKNIHVDSLIRKVGNMMSSYNEAVKIGQWEKRWRPSKLAGECRHLQIWEVQKISWSKTSVANSIAKTNCSFKISKEIFFSVRTFIMAMIYLKNAYRPGPLTLMTAADYNRRTKIEEDKEFIWVFHHKTASTHGSAEIYLTKELSKYMKIYYNVFRSQYSPSCNANNPFFVTHSLLESPWSHQTRQSS